MIFVTVGGQMPFDRLIRTVDEWAVSRVRSDVFAQIGRSDFRPKAIETTHFIDPIGFRKRFEAASLIVAHAGMGTIITALECGKAIIVIPRRGKLRETRNDHQVAMATHLLEQGRVVVAFDEQQLIERLDQFEISHEMERIKPHASPRIIATLRSFIEESHSLEPLVSRRHDANDALRGGPEHAVPLVKMVLTEGLGDEGCQAERDEKGDRGPGAPVGRDHAPHLG
jgi:UDP-N-acetylglucosamine transferase subunit ALG13